jgi:hypothetical protein
MKVIEFGIVMNENDELGEKKEFSMEVIEVVMVKNENVEHQE